jgi:hypothetical protein
MISPIQVNVCVTVVFGQDAQALLQSFAASLARIASPPTAEVTRPPQPDAPGIFGADFLPDPPLEEGPGRASSGTRGGAATHPRLSPEVPKVWTPERNAILRRDYPTGVLTDVIWKAVSCLPGKPVAKKRVAVQAAALGLKRGAAGAVAVPSPPAAKPDSELDKYLVAIREHAASMPVAPVATPDKTLPMWSIARDQVLRRDFPRNQPMVEILTSLDLLSGPMVTREDVARRATQLGLSRLKVDPEPKPDRKAIMRQVAASIGSR